MSKRLPLEGIRVIDFGQAVATPFATLWMALMGAEVIFVESHNRPFNRSWPPFADDVRGVNRSGLFNLLHINKLSCTVNLRTDEGREIVRSLVGISDIVAENYSTGTMERLGLGYQDLVRLRPDIIVLSVSALGRSGPMKDFVGFHSAVLMFSGLASITGYPNGHPRIMGSVFPDPISGMYGVFAVLGALYGRSKTGQGEYVEVAMTEAMMTLMPEAIIDYTLNDREPRRVGNSHRVKAPHGVYRCSGEDGWTAISIDSDDQWNALCDAAGHPEWSYDPRFASSLARWQHQDELDSLVQGWTREHAPLEVMHVLQSAAVPAGPSLTTADILKDPHLRERGFVVEVDHLEVGTRPTATVPWKITDLPPVEHRHAPLIGQHNHYVLCELLGLPTKRVEQLTKDGVVY